MKDPRQLTDRQAIKPPWKTPMAWPLPWSVHQGAPQTAQRNVNTHPFSLADKETMALGN